MSDKWSQFMTDQSFGRPALVDPTAMNRGMTGLRIRRELPSRDAINSRAWDSFHATPPTQVSSDNLQTPVYMDMNSKSSRFDNFFSKKAISASEFITVVLSTSCLDTFLI